MSLSLFLDMERNQAIYLLIKSFLYKSIVQRPGIADELARIDDLLKGCIRDSQVIEQIEVWYLSTPVTAETVRKEGQVTFNIDWAQNALEIKSGRSKMRISEDDPMGSISPVFTRIADEIRTYCLNDGIVELFWSIRWTSDVRQNNERRLALRKRYGIGGDYSQKMLAAEKEFRSAERTVIGARVDAAREAKAEAIWRKPKGK